VKIFADPAKKAAKQGTVEFMFRHMVDKILVDDKTGCAIGVKSVTTNYRFVAVLTLSSKRSLPFPSQQFCLTDADN
jgi:predicted oxidoreductase